MKADSSSEDPLEALEKRIKQAQRKPEAAPSGASIAFRMGSEMVAGVLVGAVFGYFADKFLGTLPLFLVIFLFIGAAAGVRMMMQTSARYITTDTPINTDNEKEL